MDNIIEWISRDDFRLKAIECVHQLDLPQCYIAAGFVRNLVWDHLHQFDTGSPLNDIDVIYFDPEEPDVSTSHIFERELQSLMPGPNWQVRNQAFMHERNGDPPYQSSLDAMSYWPEMETAVAVRKVAVSKKVEGNLECISAFGFESLLNLQITWNPKRSRAVFIQRVKAKGWLAKWPMLTMAN
ncbi:nitrate reductase [Hahella sp. CCB-MM4]|nr:nitrate reductase [Hahella sp. CCB-MM4]